MILQSKKVNFTAFKIFVTFIFDILVKINY